MALLRQKGPLYVGDRTVFFINLTDNNNNRAPVPDLGNVVCFLFNSRREVVEVAPMSDIDTPGLYVAEYVLDHEGDCIARVEVGPPLEAIFETHFYVNRGSV